jgi:hypothetical protein
MRLAARYARFRLAHDAAGAIALIIRRFAGWILGRTG